MSPRGEPSKDRQPSPSLRLSELILTLQNELQQAIEYLSLPQVRRFSTEAPSTGYVWPNKLKVRIPVRVQAREIEVPKEGLEKIPIPIKPLLRTVEAKEEALEAAVFLSIRVPTEREAPATALGDLEIEFLIAQK